DGPAHLVVRPAGHGPRRGAALLGTPGELPLRGPGALVADLAGGEGAQIRDTPGAQRLLLVADELVRVEGGVDGLDGQVAGPARVGPLGVVLAAHAAPARGPVDRPAEGRGPRTDQDLVPQRGGRGRRRGG